jgi:hydrogenase maturation protease
MMAEKKPDTTANTLILGVGNPLMGDDAVGVLVVQRLQARSDLSPDVTVIDGGTDGLGLIPVMEAYRRVILVDAVQMDQPAGTMRRFTWQDVRLHHNERTLSLHQSGLTDALLLAEALGCLPSEVVIYGVQPQNTGWDQPLSLPVERTLPVLIEALIHEVRSKKNGKENFGH